MLAQRTNRISMSPTLRIGAQAEKMRQQGIDLVDFSVGEPDFPTPEHIKAAAKQALDKNLTKYTANDGMIDLRRAICEKLRNDSGIEYTPDQIIVSSGAKASLYALSVALFDDGDDVIIPSPYWVTYPDQVRLAGANPVFVPCREEHGFRLLPEDLKRAITARTKALILCHPHNPTGCTYARADLEALAEICVSENVTIISDEIYEKLAYDGFRNVHTASLSPQVRAHTVTINGFSKAFSMTGWRLGWASGPREVIAAMSKVQSHSTSNAPSISQAAGITALRGSQTEVLRMAQEFQRRRTAMVYRLRAIPGVSCYEPKGAFYCFPHVASYFDREFQGAPISNSYGLAYYLLKFGRVAVVPGDAFGAPEYIRLSFATSMERIEVGLQRIREALGNLQAVKRSRKVVLNNTATKVRDYHEIEPDVGATQFAEVRRAAEDNLKPESYFEWNASIAGVVVQLRTNSPHLADFFQDNFFPAALEGDLEPHAVLYAVKDVPGYEPRAYYSQDARVGVVFNTAYYGQVRSLALGMAASIAERTSALHSVHATALDFDGRGVLLMGAPGSGRSTHLVGLLRNSDARLCATDTVFVRYLGGEAVCDTPERKLYVPTDLAAHLPALADRFEQCKLENVATKRGECQNDACRDQEACPIDRGLGFCFVANGVARALLDPFWLGGPARAARRTKARWTVLLRRDPVSPALERPAPDQALRILEQGSAGPGSVARSPRPWFHPHLLGLSAEAHDLQRRQFQALLKVAPLFVVNTAAGGAESVQARLRDILAGRL
jgi:aspartate/methionine/tyrosine aminotransferase